MVIIQEIYPHDQPAKSAINCAVPLSSGMLVDYYNILTTANIWLVMFNYYIDDLGVKDDEYLTKLTSALAESFAQFTPDMIIYNAGALMVCNICV